MMLISRSVCMKLFQLFLFIMFSIVFSCSSNLTDEIDLSSELNNSLDSESFSFDDTNYLVKLLSTDNGDGENLDFEELINSGVSYEINSTAELKADTSFPIAPTVSVKNQRRIN